MTDVKRQMRARVDEILNRWPAVGLALGVVRDGSTEFFYRHGVADIAAKTPVTEDTVFRIGSITKTFTAVAVMQLWEQGLVELGAPANDYLRAYRLVPAQASWRPATLRHLLTHTAGVPEWLHPSRMVNSDWFGEPSHWMSPCQPWRSTTAAVCAWRSNQARSGRTPTTGSRRWARSSRTSAASGWTAIYASTSSSRSGDNQRPAALLPGRSPACDGLHARFEGHEGADRPPRSDCGSGIDLLHAARHGTLPRRSRGRWRR
jgi:Beta-lactamase